LAGLIFHFKIEVLILVLFGFVSFALGDNSGNVTTLAGSAESSGSANGIGSEALFACPDGVAVDTSGNIYIADRGNELIRKITPRGLVTTLAGSGVKGYADGPCTLASFNNPFGIAVDSLGNVYVADTANQVIRKITSDGMVTTLAGSVGVKGFTNGVGITATFFYPTGVAVDSSGNVYVADKFNYSIRKITPGGMVSTLAGSGSDGFTNGSGTEASFYFPTGVAVDSSGNVYVAEEGNHCIRKINASGVVTTLAGSQVLMQQPSLFLKMYEKNHELPTEYPNYGIIGSADGPVTSAKFFRPQGVAVDHFGNVYVADTGNQLVREITTKGIVTTLAGTAGVIGSVNGRGAKALFHYPIGIAVDSYGDVYVADQGNGLIRKIRQY
jgi:sugar lactone lactonase YvrE